jgi:predicted DNA-binding protein (UPF0251 family)
MPRKPKWRRVEFVPNIQYFIPSNINKKCFEKNILKIEEIEAVRLKDIEKLEQEECAKRMKVSRQTFQRILNSSREKIADSIVNGKVIHIEGGNFTQNICSVKCSNCNEEWNESYENFQDILIGEYLCPYCNSKNIVCYNKDEKSFCVQNCWKMTQRNRFGKT